ncbi:MAG: FISUMP domain-containing protein [Cyclobacteriaceae bacterium]
MKIKIIGLLAILCLGFILLLQSCGDDKVEPALDPTDFELEVGTPTNIDVIGMVVDENDNPVADAEVMAGSKSTTTNTQGVFVFENAPAFTDFGTITVKKQGYFDGSRSFIPVDGDNQVKIMMLTRNTAGSFNAGSAGPVTNEGVTVDFSGTAFSANGTAYTGTVTVSMNYIDPTDPDMEEQMPGMLIGTTGEQSGILTTYGMVNVEMEDDAGNKVQIADGSSATIKYPIASAQLATAPETIDLWSYDEKGYWVKEGVATRQGNEYVGEVTHFSWVNVDVMSAPTRIRGQVKNKNGEPAGGVWVQISNNGIEIERFSTNALGFFSGITPSETSNTITVLSECADGSTQELYTQSIGPLNPGETIDFPDIEIPNESVAIISGTLVDCENNVVTSGYVIVNGIVLLADEDGQFEVTTCFSNTITIAPYINDPWQAGEQVNVFINDNSKDLGNVPVCVQAGENEVIDIDGNKYPVVTIGNQQWMAENLRTTKYNDGEAIPLIEDNTQWFNATTGAMAIYNNENSNLDKYGRLYNFYAVETGKLCPQGWHIPTGDEWNALSELLGDNDGGKLKSLTGWDAPNSGASNETGFSALPGGQRKGNGFYEFEGKNAFYWASTETNFRPDNRVLSNQFDFISSGNQAEKREGLSCRCIKD